MNFLETSLEAMFGFTGKITIKYVKSLPTYYPSCIIYYHLLLLTRMACLRKVELQVCNLAALRHHFITDRSPLEFMKIEVRVLMRHIQY